MALSTITVHAISGIEITAAGDNWRLCFDDTRNVAAKTLPASLNGAGSELIDYTVSVANNYTGLIDSASGNLESLKKWPQSNSSWG